MSVFVGGLYVLVPIHMSWASKTTSPHSADEDSGHTACALNPHPGGPKAFSFYHHSGSEVDFLFGARIYLFTFCLIPQRMALRQDYM